MTREDFIRIPELRKEINRALVLWENAKINATRTTAILTGMPKGNFVLSQVENAVIKAETYHNQYDALCDELKDIYNRIQKDSQRYLNEQEAKIIQYIYPQNLRMSEVAKKMNITERHAYRLKNTALYKICR